ncbi:MAG TPA: hypothetical protein PKA63_03415 [Oligoflexia bacterium]|nr:hypothetical protein [Oligoflexia bacterium]HMP47704.1 hypothetical protein [Oligoflexia bacterium]
MKILIFATDLPPLSGYPTSGTALRTNQIAEGLRDLGHEVIFSVPLSALDGINSSLNEKVSKEILKELNRYAFDAVNQAKIISETNPDVIFCGHWPAWTLGRKPRQPLIIDLAGPHLLERYFQGEDNYNAAVHGKLNALACADYFIVSGQKQRLYFLSWLMRAKVSRPEERICTIAMPLPPIEDQNTKNRIERISGSKTLSIDSNSSSSGLFSPSFIFGGVFLPWQDPTWGLENLSNELKNRNLGTLTLIGGKHPNYDINTGKYDELFYSLEQNPRVKRLPLLPLEKFVELLPNADVALDLMSWNLERELAITIRTTTYLWAGIPIIYNNYADLADSIKKFNAGWCIAPGDERAFREVIEEIFNDPLLVVTKSKNALLLAKELFDRKKAANQIINILDTPVISSNREIDISIDIAESCDFAFGINSTLEQHFICRINGLKEIELLFGTHGHETDGEIEINLSEYTGESDFHSGLRVVAKKSLNSSLIKNNQWVKVDFDPQLQSAGKKYTLSMRKKGSGMSPVSPWSIKSKPYPMLGLFQDGRRLGTHSLCMKTHCLKQ